MRTVRPPARDRMRALQAEVEDLRARVGLGNGVENAWDRIASQELRDEMAVKALLAEWGDPKKALIRLRYTAEAVDAMDPAERNAICAMLFETPGVKKRLAENLAAVDLHRDAILARQVRTALYGNDEHSAKSAQLIARIAGWAPEEKAPATTVNLYSMVGAGIGGAIGIANAAEAKKVAAATLSVDPLALLAHDPGAPVRIDSGDEAIAAALNRDDE